jgi:hypothetical protein
MNDLMAGKWRDYSMARHLQRACKSMNSDVHYTDSKY